MIMFVQKHTEFPIIMYVNETSVVFLSKDRCVDVQGPWQLGRVQYVYIIEREEI